jgi:hypothetical protein
VCPLKLFSSEFNNCVSSQNISLKFDLTYSIRLNQKHYTRLRGLPGTTYTIDYIDRENQFQNNIQECESRLCVLPDETPYSLKSLLVMVQFLLVFIISIIVEAGKLECVSLEVIFIQAQHLSMRPKYFILNLILQDAPLKQHLP